MSTAQRMRTTHRGRVSRCRARRRRRRGSAIADLAAAGRRSSAPRVERSASGIEHRPPIIRCCRRMRREQARQAGTAEWVRALPVGNGRLGAMVFGGIVHERLQLNEDTLWAGRPVRSGESRRERRAARGAAPPRRAQVHRCGEARRREGDVEAARADAVPDGRRSRADVSAGRCRRELPARSRPGDGDGSRVLHQRRRDVLARGVRQRARPGHRRAADRQPSWQISFEARHADAAARDGRGHRRTATS